MDEGKAVIPVGSPRRERLAVTLSLTGLLITVGVALILLAGRQHSFAVIVTISFFSYAAAAAWVGLVLTQVSAPAMLAGALAAGWAGAAVYAGTRSMTVTSVIALGIELGCVSAGPPGIDLASRWLGRAGPEGSDRTGGPPVIGVAAVMIPFLILLLPQLAWYAARRRPPG